MPFNLLLLPLIGGFYFFTEWEKTAFFAKRQEKERLVLHSAFYGIILLAISFFGSSLIPYSENLTALRLWWAYHTPPIEYSGISAFALALGYYSPKVLNALGGEIRSLFGKELQEGERVLETYGSQLEIMLYRSLVENKRVMVTLKSGKVYVGRVTISLRPQEDKDFILLPSLSGYRDDKQRLVLTTNYDMAYNEIMENEEEFIDIIEDFGIIIPLSEVVSASLYRADVHAKYFPHTDPPDSVKTLNSMPANIPTAQEEIKPEPDKKTN